MEENSAVRNYLQPFFLKQFLRFFLSSLVGIRLRTVTRFIYYLWLSFPLLCPIRCSAKSFSIGNIHWIDQFRPVSSLSCSINKDRHNVHITVKWFVSPPPPSPPTALHVSSPDAGEFPPFVTNFPSTSKLWISFLWKLSRHFNFQVQAVFSASISSNSNKNQRGKSKSTSKYATNLELFNPVHQFWISLR